MHKDRRNWSHKFEFGCVSEPLQTNKTIHEQLMNWQQEMSSKRTYVKRAPEIEF
jgi:hypothetical protein